MSNRLYKVMMRCGHSANAMKQVAVDDEIPCCAICNCDEIDENKPDLTNRKTQCSYCNKIVKSDFRLPFFEYRPNCEFDSYYCGCRGWN